MTVILTIWHNNIGRPIPCLGLPNGYAGRSGISPYSPESSDAVSEFVRTMDRYGAAILEDNQFWPSTNHRVHGTKHDDADWCESRFEEGSMAAYYENDPQAHVDPVEVIRSRATNPRNYF